MTKPPPPDPTLRDRHAALVDAKYLHGLTPDEAAELAWLAAAIDAHYAAWDLEILKQLEARKRSKRRP